jgi:hypothetical protein
VKAEYVPVTRLRETALGTRFLAVARGAGGGATPVELTRLVRTAENEMWVDMFVDECVWAFAQVKHPNLLAVVDYGYDDEGPFVVTERPPGPSLEAVLTAASAPPLAVAVRACRDALLGLHGLHEARAGDGTPLHATYQHLTPYNPFVPATWLRASLRRALARPRAPRARRRVGAWRGPGSAPRQV